MNKRGILFNHLQKTIATLLVCTMVFQLWPQNVIYAKKIEEGMTKIDIQKKESKIVGEDVSKRTENEKHFLLEDGSMIAAVYPENVHYEKDGKLEEIDNTLVEQQEEVNQLEMEPEEEKRIENIQEEAEEKKVSNTIDTTTIDNNITDNRIKENNIISNTTNTTNQIQDNSKEETIQQAKKSMENNVVEEQNINQEFNTVQNTTNSTIETQDEEKGIEKEKEEQEQEVKKQEKKEKVFATKSNDVKVKLTETSKNRNLVSMEIESNHLRWGLQNANKNSKMYCRQEIVMTLK